MCKFRGLWARRPGEATVGRSRGPSIAERLCPLLPAHLSSEDQPHQPLPGGQAYAFAFMTLKKNWELGQAGRGWPRGRLELGREPPRPERGVCAEPRPRQEE